MWDDDIDEVARALTRQPPPAGLKARVMERIAHRTSRRHSWRVWWVMVPAAITAALAVALVVSNNRHEDPKPSLAPVARERQPVPPPSPAMSVSAPAHTTPQRHRATRQQAVGNVEEPASVASLPQLDALPFSALELDPIQVSTIPPLTKIDVTGLAMAPLLFVPLTPNEPQSPH